MPDTHRVQMKSSSITRFKPLTLYHSIREKDFLQTSIKDCRDIRENNAPSLKMQWPCRGEKFLVHDVVNRLCPCDDPHDDALLS